jgi:hypothetical protein
MNKFKAGDKVRRIGDSWGNTIIGEIYIVLGHEGRYLYLIGDSLSYDPSDFELSEDMSCPPSEQQIITVWLDKLAYVLHNDSTVRNGIYSERDCLLLQGDLADIRESADIYQYVVNTYDQLKSQEIQKKSQKLLEQKEALAKQLANIEKELENLK